MKIKLEDLIQQIIEEAQAFGASHSGRDSGYSFLGRNMAPYTSKGAPAPSGEGEETFKGEIVPAARTRIPSPESYGKVYSFLMGHPKAAIIMSVEKIMKKTLANCPQSSAQAVADFLNDRQSAGTIA